MHPSRYWIGVDLHARVVQVCVLDAQGQLCHEDRWTGDDLGSGRARILELSRRFPQAAVAVEAMGCNRWFVESCRAQGLEVTVVHPGGLGLKSSGRKNDRRDAYELARRLRLGDLDSNARAYFASPREYGLRQLTRRRHSLVQIRTSLITQLRAMLRAHRLPQPGGDLYGPRNLEKLGAIELSNSYEAKAFAALLSALRSAHEAVDQLDRAVREISDRDTVCSMLKTLPYVGPLTSVTLVAELGDVHRFRNAKAVASYAGLVPRVSQSADREIHGRLVSHGSRELRYVLGEWAVQLLSRHREVKAWAEKRLLRMHKNKVRVTLARKLLVGVWHTLRTGEVFQLERCLASA